jgi:SAM-dependent methyltransferase
MRNPERWLETKFVTGPSGLVGSRRTADLAVSSRLAGDLLGIELSRVLAAHASGRVLDLGCGRVPLYGHYRDAATAVVCADWPQSLHDSQHVDVFCDVGSTLPVRDAVADTVVSSDVLEHLPDPATVFAEVARVLAPGGVLILNTPFLYPVHEAPHDYLRHTRHSLERHARLAGLEVVELVAVGGLLDVLADHVAKALAALPVVGGLLAAVLQRSTVWFGTTAPGRAARAATSAVFPLAHVLVARRPEVAA